jgi:hypothetical protein
MKPDPESGQAILIRKIRALNLADILHLRKLSMVLFCALNPTTRLEQFQLGGTPLRKISKAVAPRDTEQLFGRVDEKTHDTISPYKEQIRRLCSLPVLRCYSLASNGVTTQV